VHWTDATGEAKAWLMIPLPEGIELAPFMLAFSVCPCACVRMLDILFVVSQCALEQLCCSTLETLCLYAI